MAREQPKRRRTVGHVPHDALVRVDRRVKEILARREAALQQARRAAARLKKSTSYRARVLSAKPTSSGRLQELERTAAAADARLRHGSRG